MGELRLGRRRLDAAERLDHPLGGTTGDLAADAPVAQEDDAVGDRGGARDRG